MFVTDTAPSDDVWALAAKARKLKAVLLEATFPTGLQWLADKAKHLTTAQFGPELAKAPAGVRRLAIHFIETYRLRPSSAAAQMAALGTVAASVEARPAAAARAPGRC